VKERRMRWVGHVACIGEERSMQGFGGELEGKRLLGRPRHRWDNIKMDLRNGMGRHGLNISGGKLGHMVGSFECGNGPLGSVECSKYLI